MPASPDSDTPPPATIDVLKRRAALLQRLREFFNQAGYWEVETPLLSADCCIDAWLDPFAVPLDAATTAYLQTSPEFAMKRLLCAGADAIYQITRSFRRDEAGPLHNPEFTIVEWYRCHEDHFAQMDFVERLVGTLVFSAVERAAINPPAVGDSIGRPTPLRSPFARLSYEEAFIRYAGISALTSSPEELTVVARRHGIPLPPAIGDEKDALLNVLLSELVEPGLKQLEAVFLYDYPSSQAALARIRDDALPVAERFELYLHGIEICNGYHELTDAEELRSRMQQQNARRIASGKPPLPVDSRLLEAMCTGFPDCSGVALGFDRLAMFCLGLTKIHEVIAFTLDHRPHGVGPTTIP